MHQRHALAVTLVLLAAGAVWADEAKPEKELKTAVDRLAENIKKHLDTRGDKAIVVGQFLGPGNAGPGIQATLIDSLKGMKVTAEESAPLEVRGEYALAPDARDPEVALLQIEANLREHRTGKPLGGLNIQPVRVKNNIDLAKLFAAIVTLPPTATPEKRNEIIQERIKEPKFHADGPRIASDPKSPFKVEIIVNGKPREPRVVNGEPFVDIKQGEIYEVRVINEAPFDAAVTLAIDGLDQFHFSKVQGKDGKPAYSHVIVGRGSAGNIEGWHVTNKEVATFLVGKYGEGPSSKLLKNDARTGTLVLTFSAAWEKDEDKPADEGGKSASETVLGPPKDVDLKELSRKVGDVRSVVSIRYSSK